MKLSTRNIFLSSVRSSFIAGAILSFSFANADEASENKEFAKSKGCFECHGSTGNTGWDSPPPVPKIAGQPKSYLIKAMNDYRTGARQDKQMNLIFSIRTDEDIERLAEHYSTQKRY